MTLWCSEVNQVLRTRLPAAARKEKLDVVPVSSEVHVVPDDVVLP
jgi:hypothetical protein